MQTNSVNDNGGEADVMGRGGCEQRGSSDPGKQSSGHLGSIESGVHIKVDAVGDGGASVVG